MFEIRTKFNIFYLQHFSHFQNYSIFGLFRENVKEYIFVNILKFEQNK